MITMMSSRPLTNPLKRITLGVFLALCKPNTIIGFKHMLQVDAMKYW